MQTLAVQRRGATSPGWVGCDWSPAGPIHTHQEPSWSRDVSKPCPFQAGVFDVAAEKTVAMFAEQASVVLANAEAFNRAQNAAINLGEALTSRAVIDMAKGMVMARERCTPDDAFDRLRELSQTQHRKLLDIAQELVDGATGDEDLSGRPGER